MLSKEYETRLEILEICKNSGDIDVGEHFSGVMYSNELYNKPCVCIGKTERTRLFRTEDRTCYFTVSGGWGEKEGELVEIEIGSFLRFDKPSGIEEIRDYIDNMPAAHSRTGAIVNDSKRKTANMYIKALEKYLLKWKDVIAKRGVFWLVDGELLAFPFDENDTEGVAKSGNTYNHKLLWEAKKPCNKPFDYYPRGRVEITKSGEVKIFMNPNIGEELIPLIKIAFGITTEPKIIYDRSEHYKCHFDK